MLKIAALTIFVIASTIDYTKGCNSCPPSWQSMGRTCIRLFHQSSLTFDEAEEACNAYKVVDCSGSVLSKGHLVSVHSQKEQDILVKLVEETLAARVVAGWNPQVYIGMSVGRKNQQTWTDGSTVDFTSWFPGEPNNTPNSRGAIAAGRDWNGNWADVLGDRLPYICELSCFKYQLPH